MTKPKRGHDIRKIRGSMETLSAMQITADMQGLDAQSKSVLHSREVLAVILREIIPEYEGYSRKEVMGFIEMDTLTDTKEISPGRTNSQIRGDSAEFIHLNEKTSYFDLAFRAINPLLSDQDVSISLHIDLECQKDHRPGYPIEKRGVYYLARRLSSQLSLCTGQTDYGQLEKCYSVWLCRDNIPKKERYSISTYEMSNTKNTGRYVPEKATYDLLTMVIVRLGEAEYHGGESDEGYEVLRFLNMLMYPHRKDFMKVMSEYIDFSENKELWEEVARMNGLGQSVLEEGIEQGIEQGGLYRLIDQVGRKLEKGKKEEEIADELEEELPLIQKICDAINMSSPDVDQKRVYIILRDHLR